MQLMKFRLSGKYIATFPNIVCGPFPSWVDCEEGQKVRSFDYFLVRSRVDSQYRIY